MSSPPPEEEAPVGKADPYAGVVVASKLSLKKKKKKKREAEALVLSTEEEASAQPGEEHLTEAERRHKKRFVEKRKQEVAKAVAKSHREKIEEFNEKLGSLTEHNDIPRISAAGNG